MPRRLLRAALLVVGVAGLLALTSPTFAGAPTVHAASSCVTPGGTGGCLASIQAAVSAAAAGDTITVAAGTYKESVTITKSLTLQGAGASSTIVDASGANQAFLIQGTSGVQLTGFTAENATLEGILVDNASQVTVSGNLVQKNDQGWQAPSDPKARATCPGAAPFDQDDCGEGLHIRGVSDSTIADNIVQHNVGGILVTDETGPTHDNWLVGNIVQNNDRDCAITLASHPAGLTPPAGPPPAGYGIYNNTIENNVAANNGAAGVGIFTPTPGTNAYDNLVIGNTLTGNGLPGVALHSHAGNQNLNGNVIMYNTISGNGADDDAGAAPTGIIIFSDAKGQAAPIDATVIAHNRISGETNGIWVGTTATNVSAHFNDLTGNGVGVNNAGTGTVDAGWNYWGCPGGPGASGCVPTMGTIMTAGWLPSPPVLR
ncbi:MAG TPA: right-handed parallel beta-helix repeat-containing protein [Ktedonobacterales bacterium]|nr:right-handed parallel beta-helix repeat-containing protein [Ktedonobacterales bacterium]